MIKYIELYTENCQIVRFEANEIHCFETAPIEEFYSCYRPNSGEKFKQIKGFTLIVPDKSGTHDPLGDELPSGGGTERLRGKDITSVTVFMEDDSHETLIVYWPDTGNPYEHYGQGYSLGYYGQHNMICFWSETDGYESGMKNYCNYEYDLPEEDDEDNA